MPLSSPVFDSTTIGIFNTEDYGVDASGANDSQAAIEATVVAAVAAGGGIVQLPPGTVLVTSPAHPTQAGRFSALVWRSNIWFRGAGEGATILKLADNQNAGTITWIVSHYNMASGDTDTNMMISDMTIDGNYANQGGGAKLRDEGILLKNCTHVHHENVTVKNVFGTGEGGDPSTEGFAFHVAPASNITYSNCTGRGAGPDTDTSSLFSSSSGNNVQYSNCKALRSGRAMGFTNNFSSGVQYINCISEENAFYGFNLEYSRGVSYMGCRAGGIPVPLTGLGGAVTITGVSKSSPGTVTATGHGFVTDDRIYIGGNFSSQVASTEVQGMYQILDDVFHITRIDDDNFTIGVDTTSYGTYTSGGVAVKTKGNYLIGFRNQSGWDISYTGCAGIANGGAGANARSGMTLQGSTRRISVANSIFTHNTAYGIDTASATLGSLRLAGDVRCELNDGAPGARLGLRDRNNANGFLTSAYAAGATTVAVSATTGLVDNTSTIAILMRNGNWHITTIGVVSGLNVPITALPYETANSTPFHLHKTANVRFPHNGALTVPRVLPSPVPTGTQYVNDYPFPATVYVYGGTVGTVTVNGVTIGSAVPFSSGFFTLEPGAGIYLDYTADPTWQWFKAS